MKLHGQRGILPELLMISNSYASYRFIVLNWKNCTCQLYFRTEDILAIFFFFRSLVVNSSFHL
jgi:hypothetical protein